MWLISYVLTTYFIVLSSSYMIEMVNAGSIISHSGPNEFFRHRNMNVEVKKKKERARERRSPSFFQTYNPFPNWLISSNLYVLETPLIYISDWNSGRYLNNKGNLYERLNSEIILVPSTDMRMLYWSDELAASAQRHANRCDFRHSRDRINVGENIWAAPFANYTEAVGRWFDEIYDQRCQCKHAYKHCCGHYVQVVWARTNLVGCGYARCHDIWGVQGRGHHHIFVCHYNPQGNTVFVTGNRQLFAVQRESSKMFALSLEDDGNISWA
uniref:SCP domain-containing protein n=1 Tax=Parascaris equorum TaxID=6256 RepID=A0A914RJY2_PAREQ